MTIKLGVIGLSEGNGHPYSWSAIFNGYSPTYMQECEFPVIPQYLAEQCWPEARIAGAEVTHIWTQSPDLSARIARASLIPNIVDNPTAMIGHVDALLLARDDAKNHLSFAKPFLESGLPIYIDKPIALSTADLYDLYELEKYEGQIFSCSALRYAEELMLTENQRKLIGRIQHIQANTPKSWEKYAVHIIEPVLRILGDPGEILYTHAAPVAESGRAVVVGFDGAVTVNFLALGENVASPFSIRVYGEKGWGDLVFSNTFSAFRRALQEFIEGIKTNTCRSPFKFNRQVVSIIESGLVK